MSTEYCHSSVSDLTRELQVLHEKYDRSAKLNFDLVCELTKQAKLAKDANRENAILKAEIAKLKNTAVEETPPPEVRDENKSDQESAMSDQESVPTDKELHPLVVEQPLTNANMECIGHVVKEIEELSKKVDNLTRRTVYAQRMIDIKQDIIENLQHELASARGDMSD